MQKYYLNDFKSDCLTIMYLYKLQMCIYNLIHKKSHSCIVKSFVILTLNLKISKPFLVMY